MNEAIDKLSILSSISRLQKNYDLLLEVSVLEQNIRRITNHTDIEDTLKSIEYLYNKNTKLRVTS